MIDVVEVMARAISLSAAKTANGWDQWSNEARAALAALNEAGYVVVERKELEYAVFAIEDWAGYASDYFKEKHDLQGDLERARAMLSAAQPAPK